MLGVDVVESADTTALSQGDQGFPSEATALNPADQPETVNTDGWEHTPAAWKQSLPGIRVVLCFLHVVLDIQQRCCRTKPWFRKLTGKLWQVYQSTTKRQFAQRLRRLREWSDVKVKQKPVRQQLLNLRAKSAKFPVVYAHPNAERTSNSLDRLSNYQDRLLYSMQYFHGPLDSARLQLRAIALLWNFPPSGPRTRSHNPNRSSPFEELNG